MFKLHFHPCDYKNPTLNLKKKVTATQKFVIKITDSELGWFLNTVHIITFFNKTIYMDAMKE